MKFFFAKKTADLVTYALEWSRKTRMSESTSRNYRRVARLIQGFGAAKGCRIMTDSFNDNMAEEYLHYILSLKPQKGRNAYRLSTVRAMVDKTVSLLRKAKREGTLDRLLADVGRAGLVILDEFGYVPFDVDGARLLYQVISDSYERRSIVFTTNVEFSRWGTVFADDKLAAAIVDRVVHHGRLVEFGGPSHRLEESLMLGKSGR